MGVACKAAHQQLHDLSCCHATVLQVFAGLTGHWPKVRRCGRRAWHLEDKIRLLRTLRWGEIGYANLRHANMVCPEVWNCKWLRLDWRWSGNWLHPRDWDNGTKLQVGHGLTRQRPGGKHAVEVQMRTPAGHDTDLGQWLVSSISPLIYSLNQRDLLGVLSRSF